MARFNYYIAIDLKSFYASVECVLRGLDAFSTPLAVCDPERGPGSIVLAVSPYLRSLGVPSRLRKYELPPLKDLILAPPRMATYLTYNAHFNNILLDYVGEDDLHIYSVDESFVNIGPYLKLYEKSPNELALEILSRIKNELGLTAVAGIGPNMFLAKIAMDVEAKKRPNNIAHWRLSDVENKLWPLTPLSKMWGISSCLERRLNNIGIRKVGDLALYSRAAIKNMFGVVGEALWEHANGIDDTDIRIKYTPASSSLSNGQILDRDYTYAEIFQIVVEMNDDLARRLRKRQACTDHIGLMIQFAKEDAGSFHKNIRLLIATDNTDELANALLNILKQKNIKEPIRGVFINYGHLTSNSYQQLSLFNDEEKQLQARSLTKALDDITDRYGLNAVLRADSLIKSSTAKRRHEQIGGHRR
ncbi:MAG: damage repair protein [Bacilli bacterium]|jgi:DNA polymerase V|nr:damage repair protein [Bacilli bacterium]MDD3389252.1 damage repair protein [Bacilli bacterium]MDD4344854.1 damage repair protein [Bacilli bacterium]MDD4520760.1 damage repair protein [Bacilli bacterium]MDY0399466.1 damage repair protein [Bacilli bacterium]